MCDLSHGTIQIKKRRIVSYLHTVEMLTKNEAKDKRRKRGLGDTVREILYPELGSQIFHRQLLAGTYNTVVVTTVGQINKVSADKREKIEKQQPMSHWRSQFKKKSKKIEIRVLRTM
jgi:hypothetical protein